MDVQEVLTSFGLESLIPVFIEHEISMEILESIEEIYLKELIPLVGQRVKFIQRRKEYLENKQSIECGQPSLSGAESLAGRQVEVLAVRPIVSASTSASTTCVSNSTFASASSSVSLSTSTSAPTRASTLVTTRASTSSSTPASTSANSSAVTKSTFVRNVAAQFCLNKFIVDLDLESVFTKHVGALAASNFYAANSYLCFSHRTSIVDALMCHLYLHAKSFGCADSIKNDHLSLLADRIVGHFNGETKSTYYIPPQGRSISHAKLPNKLRNLRRKDKDKQATVQSISEESVDDPVEGLLCATEDPDIDVDAAVNFLAFTRSPWPEVEQKWAVTHQRRLRQLKEQPFLSQYFESWPVLQSPNGCTLLEADFNSLWPGRDVIIFSKWPLFEEKVLQLAKTDVKDKQSKAILNLIKPNTSPDARTAITLSLLPALCPPTKKLKLSNGRLWLPSIEEARSSMLLHAQSASGVRTALKAYTDKVFLQGQRVQPLIVVVGPSLDKITKTYVCVDKILWATSCVMKSIDICFKAVFATESEYPAQSRHLWEAIQKCIYKINTKFDKCSCALENIV